MSHDGYERPHAKWVCGNSDCGHPCAAGPNLQGDCPETHPCSPIKEGDRWRCTRSKLHGGPCAEGPASDGTCGLPVQRCVPAPSLRARRGGFVFASLAVVVGGFALTLGSPDRNEVLVPGGLTTAHAQILREQGTDRCATCHEQGRGSFADWASAAATSLLASSAKHPSLGPTQTDLCLECHKSRIDPAFARNSHTAEQNRLFTFASREAPLAKSPSSTQALSTETPSTELPQLACSACHQEHHGSAHDLTQMTTAQCNSCHRVQFADFASSHPEFEGWPYQRRARIAFTHAAHQAKHFPAQQMAFDCRACHESSSGEVVSTVGFEHTCAACHERTILQSFGEGLELIKLPILDAELLADYGLEVGEWPEAVRGDFDGSLSPLVRLLLAADPEAQPAFEKFGPDFDFFDINPDDLEDLELASDLIWALKMLLRDLAEGDRAKLRQRLNTAISREHRQRPSQEHADQLLANLPWDQFQAAQQTWLPNVFAEIPADQQLFSQQQVDQPPADEAGLRPAVDGPRAIRDDSACVLRMTPQGHASEFARYWIETLLASRDSWSHAETLLESAHTPGAAGACLSCHSIDRAADGQLQVNWRGGAAASTFTKFNHSPHLTIPQLQDCTTCHTYADHPDESAYFGYDPHQNDGTFLPISKANCATCHNARTQTDQCTTCHQYHVSTTAEPRLQVPGQSF